MAEDGPFGMDDDDDEDFTIIFVPDAARKHDRGSILTGLLALSANIAADVSKFFEDMSVCSSQHNRAKWLQNDFHEEVTRELETLPVVAEEEGSDG